MVTKGSAVPPMTVPMVIPWDPFEGSVVNCRAISHTSFAAKTCCAGSTAATAERRSASTMIGARNLDVLAILRNLL
jgi:hypothetical protein